MPITVYTASGTAGCAPRFPETRNEEPSVLLVLVCGRDAMVHELNPIQAQLLGQALLDDASKAMQVLPAREPREEEEEG